MTVPKDFAWFSNLLSARRTAMPGTAPHVARVGPGWACGVVHSPPDSRIPRTFNPYT